MVRQEYILAGCILVVVGVALCIVGYNKTQPTEVDSAVSILESISGEEVPVELGTNRSGGYALLGIGVLCLLAGIGFILTSRMPSSTKDNQ
jgi:hypothetical protein